jgi:GNAT superfamily N-acetyltransferase
VSADLERIERDAFADAFAAAPADVAARHGIAARPIGAGVVCTVIADVDSLMLNRTSGLGIDEPATEAAVERIVEAFGETRFAVALAPSARPAETAAWLRAAGFEAGYAWMKFRRGADPPADVATDLRVAQAGPEDGRAFAQPVVEGFGMPAWGSDWLAAIPGRRGWGCYVAWDGHEPAAAGAVFLQPPLAWFGLAATRPEFRRRGGQGAIMVARIRAAIAAGCSTLVTETGERVDGRPSNSYRNILRYGFGEAYVRPNYVSPEPLDVA